MEASEKMREATKAVSRMEDAEKVLREYNYDKTKLVPILQAAQARYNWLSKELLSYIACALGLPPARVYGVATFYAHFSLKPKGKTSSASATEPHVTSKAPQPSSTHSMKNSTSSPTATAPTT